MKRWFLALALLLYANPTDACNLPHHETADLTAFHNHIAIGWDQADFAVGQHHGSWQSVTLNGEYAPLRWLALSARLPVARIQVNDQDSAFGLGDMDAGVRAQVLDVGNGAFQWTVGVNVIAPTGNADKGLGSGHAALAGHTAFNVRLHSDVFLAGLVQYAGSLKGNEHSHDHDHDHGGSSADDIGGSLIAPHGDQELSGVLGLTMNTKFGYVGTGAEVIYGIKEPVGMGPINLHLNLGVDLSKAWQIRANMSLPVTDKTRYLWRTNLSLHWTFGSSDTHVHKPAEKTGCGCGRK